MPRPRKSVPSYLRHKARDLAFVRIPDGKGGRRTVYLGRYGSPESRAEYQRVLKLLETAPGPHPTVTPLPPAAPVVNEVVVAFVTDSRVGNVPLGCRGHLTGYEQTEGNR